ncbi:MAG: twin-arginine translocase subunit TatC [Cytophagales bacterium]|nr:MAG: twin-arginine translocase subunit TatC [Cytophagales bacterium]TAF60057.1 MAG: twin-arginine translocase subunit TatC [Cytophagales bacterium]
MSSEKDMPFLDHLEELRWHIIRALVGLLVVTVVAFTQADFLFGTVIFGPSRPDFITYQWICELSQVLCIDKLPFTIQNRVPSGQFTMHILVSVVAGFIIAFPYIFWEIWRFITPALYGHEQKVAAGATFFVTLLFMLGISFGYFAVVPLTLNFLSNYQVHPDVVNEYDLGSYVSTITLLVMGCGLMFQLPMVAFFLSRLGIVTPSMMRSYRRHAIVVILIVAAIITPPDVVSQILVGTPLLLLYEISIYVSAVVHAKKKRELEKREENNFLQV